MTLPVEEPMDLPSPAPVSPPSAPDAVWPSRWWFVLIAILTLLLVQLFRDPASTEQMLFGWLYFPVQTIPKMTADWPTAILGLISAGLFVPGLHWTVRWFIQPSGPDGLTRQWSWRASAGVSLLLVLLFCAGTAMVGMTHQFVWLLTGKRSVPSSLSPEAPPVGLWSLASDAHTKSTEGFNLKSTAMAFQSVEDVYRALPPGGTMDRSGRLLHGWPIFLSGYLTFAIHDRDGGPVSFDRSRPWNDPVNAPYFRCAISEFINPALPGPRFDKDGFGLCHVAGNAHVLPVQVVETQTKDRFGWEDSPRQGPTKDQRQSSADDQSNTILLGTVAQRITPWGYPANVRNPAKGVNRDPEGFGGPAHWNGAMFVLRDGRVRFVSNAIDPKLLETMGSPPPGDARTTESPPPRPSPQSEKESKRP